MTTTNLVTTADVLFAAAAHLEKVGLHKGSFIKDTDRPNESPCCALGAIRVVSGFYTDDGHFNRAAYNEDAFITARLALEDTLDGVDVPDWNDRIHQRKDRVVKHLRKVASNLRSEA